jgi:predicted small lipoprotein YifL
MTGRRARAWLLAVAVLSACAGCGFKGPLYLPGRHATVVTHPAPAAPAGAGTQAPPAKKKRSATPPPPPSPAPPQ